jgi:hypothetical protein
MPQGDYDEALKRALYISAEWLKIFNTGKEGCRVVGMLMQDGWDDATGIWVRFYYTNRNFQEGVGLIKHKNMLQIC